MVLPAAAEKDNSDNNPDDDEDGRPHPDPNHCLNGQHLGVNQGYDEGGEEDLEETKDKCCYPQSGFLTLCLHKLFPYNHILGRNISTVDEVEYLGNTFSYCLFSCISLFGRREGGGTLDSGTVYCLASQAPV